MDAVRTAVACRAALEPAAFVQLRTDLRALHGALARPG